MRLASVHFAGMVPIPGGDSVEKNFHASDGWTIERREDGSVRLTNAEKSFVADGFSYSYVEERLADYGRPRAESGPKALERRGEGHEISEAALGNHELSAEAVLAGTDRVEGFGLAPEPTTGMKRKGKR